MLIISGMVEAVTEYNASAIWRRLFLDTVEVKANDGTKASAEDRVASEGCTLEALASHVTVRAGGGWRELRS